MTDVVDNDVNEALVYVLNAALLSTLEPNSGVVIEYPLNELSVVWSTGAKVIVTPYEDCAAYRDSAHLQPLSHLVPGTKVRITQGRIN